MKTKFVRYLAFSLFTISMSPFGLLAHNQHHISHSVNAPWAGIVGRVVDSNGYGCPAAITLVNAPIGTSTDAKGNFAFFLAPGTYTIRIVAVGCTSVEITFTIGENQSFKNLGVIILDCVGISSVRSTLKTIELRPSKIEYSNESNTYPDKNIIDRMKQHLKGPVVDSFF